MNTLEVVEKIIKKNQEKNIQKIVIENQEKQEKQEISIASTNLKERHIKNNLYYEKIFMGRTSYST